MNIAVISPNEIPETFVQMHLNKLEGNVFHLYDSWYLPKWAKNYGSLIKPYSIIDQIWHYINYKLFGEPFPDPHERGISVFLVSNNIDVVLAEYGMTGCAIYPLLKKIDIPIVVHFHGHDVFRNSILKVWSNKYRGLFDFSSKLISVSNDMTNKLVELRADRSKIVLNPCGVNERFLSICPDYQSPFFLSVGRFVDKKAPYLTIMAFNSVYRRNPGCRLIMVGDGYLLNTCRNLVEFLGISQGVKFTGNLKHQEVENLMAECFCFVQHSIVADDGDSEGTPVAVMEAMAAGLPVVASNHAGIKDIIEDERSGYLVAEKDVEMMTTRMESLYMDRRLSRIIGQSGKKTIKNGYTEKHHMTTLNQVINELLKV